MTGTILDVDAPNTAWRGGSEDPIPVIFGRYAITAFGYRWITARPLDGHARTDATFWRPGTKAFTKSGRTMPYQYWPGWKRGLLLTRMPPTLGLWSGAAYLGDHFSMDAPWYLHPLVPGTGWGVLAGFGTYKGVRYVQGYRHEKNVLRPIRQATWAILRTRDGVYVDIPAGMVKGRDVDAVGRIGLPSEHPLHDGDRDNLLDTIRERLGHEALDGRWNMEGAHPWLELHTPPQPPREIEWDIMLGHADMSRPYLGHTAHGPVHWDMGQDSPHLAVAGGSGSGKSELVAWIVSQFMRAGAGVVVLDPKYVSHSWMSRVPEVLYCREAQMIQDTVLWLDAELRRRGAAAVEAVQRGLPEPEFERIVIVLEERNSLQTVITDHWRATRPTGSPMTPPARAALDRLTSMGRSFGMTVVLAAQEVTKADIGSRNNFGAFALAGRLPVGAWRLAGGPGMKKPAMKTVPGRFGYLVGGEVQVFQAAYPNLKQEAERLIAFATSGNQLLDVRTMMQQHEGVPFPSWEPAASPDETTEEYVTLSQFAELDDCPYTLAALRLHSQRDGRNFPDSQGTGAKNAKLYRLSDLLEWLRAKTEEEQ